MPQNFLRLAVALLVSTALGLQPRFECFAQADSGTDAAPAEGAEGAPGDEGPGAGGGAAPAPPQDPTRGVIQMLVIFGPLVLLWWMLILRPNRKRDQQRREMLSQMKKNDHVVTIGGIKGVVTSVKKGNRPDEDEVVIKVDEALGVKLRVVSSSIARIESTGSDEPASKAN